MDSPSSRVPRVLRPARTTYPLQARRGVSQLILDQLEVVEILNPRLRSRRNQKVETFSCTRISYETGLRRSLSEPLHSCGSKPVCVCVCVCVSSSTRVGQSQILSQKRRLPSLKTLTYGVCACDFDFRSHDWSCSSLLKTNLFLSKVNDSRVTHTHTHTNARTHAQAHIHIYIYHTTHTDTHIYAQDAARPVPRRLSAAIAVCTHTRKGLETEEIARVEGGRLLKLVHKTCEPHALG